MGNDKPVVIPVLGRPGFSLGCLYDLSTHTVYVRKLWDEEELQDDKIDITPLPGTRIPEFRVSNSQDDRPIGVNDISYKNIE